MTDDSMRIIRSAHARSRARRENRWHGDERPLFVLGDGLYSSGFGPLDGSMNCPVCNEEHGVHIEGGGYCEPDPYFSRGGSPTWYLEGSCEAGGCRWRVTFTNFKGAICVRRYNVRDEYAE